MGVGKYLAKLNPAHDTVGGRVAETVEFMGLSYGVGYLQNRYRQKASVAGVPLDLAGGAVAKAGALAVDLFGGGKWHHGVRGVLRSQGHLLGNVALGAFFHTLGAGKGAQASGVKRLLIRASDVDKAKKVFPDATILGDIGPAPHGDLLSASQLSSLSQG